MSRTKKHKLKNMGNLCASAPKNLDNGVGNKPEGIVKGSKVSLIPTCVLNCLLSLLRGNLFAICGDTLTNDCLDDSNN